MFFKGEVYFESRLEWKHDIAKHFADFSLKARKENIKIPEIICQKLNYSWNHPNEWQLTATVNFEVDDDVYGLTTNAELAKRFIRDLFDVYFSDEKLTARYIEDAKVESDDGDDIVIPDFYLISSEEFGDEQDSIAAQVSWENFKRSEEFANFVAAVPGMSYSKWSRQLSLLRRQNATAEPEKVKLRNMKHIEAETMSNDKRKIFILDLDEV